MKEKINPIWELESTEANLSDDIQALAYIQDDLETAKMNTEMLIKIPEVLNHIQMLLKAMIYNRDKMQKAIEQYYKEAEENEEYSAETETKRQIYVDDNGVKHIRMGRENDFIKGVILSDGTMLQNMQCSLDAKIPTDEELLAIDDKNYKSREEK